MGCLPQDTKELFYLWSINGDEIAGIHSLNVTQSNDNGVVSFLNEERGELEAPLGQKNIPKLHLSRLT